MRLVILTVVLLVTTSCVTASPSENPSVDASKVISATQSALKAASQDLANYGLSLQQVTLTLNTTVSKDGSGSVKILFFKVGGGKDQAITNQLKVELKPIDPTAAIDVSEERQTIEKLAGDLVNSIVAIAASLKDTASGDTPLSVVKVTGDLKFVVKQSGEAGVEFELDPISAEVGGKMAQSYTQSLTVVVGRGG